jgi:hypothetical protein
MASQETPEMAQKTAQTTTVPVAPAPAHSLPQELAAAGYQPYYQPYPGQPTVAPTPAESTKGAYTRLGFHGVVVVLGAIGLGVSLSSLGGDEGYGIGAAAAPGVCCLLFFRFSHSQRCWTNNDISRPLPVSLGVSQNSSPERCVNGKPASTRARTWASASSSGS